MTYFIFGVVAVIGFILGVWMTNRKRDNGGFVGKTESEMDEIHNESREALKERTEGRKDKVLKMMRREAKHQEELANCNVGDRQEGVTCAEVAKELDVSEQTAGKYLNELEKSGQVEQIGATGRSVHYKLKQG